jgi:hypothetical protein
MTIPNRNELKRELVAQGFEVYRTLPDRVVFADRVRDNLIMDSGVSAGLADGLAVRFTARAQASDFPGEDASALWGRARALGSAGLAAGYREVAADVVAVRDPGDKSRTLDTWYEVSFELRVSSVAELIEEVRKALRFEKVASASKRG